MSSRPPIFISTVSRELKSARQLVANTLTFLGYEPVWQNIFGTESGDLRAILRQQIDRCKGVVQVVGQCYGAEPPMPDAQLGRVSYTQYEALYARQRGKKVWYLFIDETFPIDAHEREPDELRGLQAAYRRRLQSDTHVFHPLTSNEALEASVLKLRDDLTRLRRGAKRWAGAVAVMLIVIAGLVIWLVRGQSEAARKMEETEKALSAVSVEPPLVAAVPAMQLFPPFCCCRYHMFRTMYLDAIRQRCGLSWSEPLSCASVRDDVLRSLRNPDATTVRSRIRGC